MLTEYKLPDKISDKWFTACKVTLTVEGKSILNKKRQEKEAVQEKPKNGRQIQKEPPPVPAIRSKKPSKTTHPLGPSNPPDDRRGAKRTTETLAQVPNKRMKHGEDGSTGETTLFPLTVLVQPFEELLQKIKAMATDTDDADPTCVYSRCGEAGRRAGRGAVDRPVERPVESPVKI